MKKIIFCIVFLFAGTIIFGQGHYNGSSFNPNDYFAPHAGWIIPVWYGYANMDYHNAAGKKSDQLINPAPGNPTDLKIKQNVVTNSFILMAIYGGKGKILGANWGMMIIPTLNSPTANIALDYYSSQQVQELTFSLIRALELVICIFSPSGYPGQKENSVML